jgi:hypothetical protein
MVRLQSDGKLPWSRLRGGAHPAGGTRATGGPVKADANDRIPRHLMSRPPIDAGMALGTVHRLRVPISDEGLQVIALARPSLPAIGPQGRPDDIDLMLGLGGDEEVRIDIAAVQQGRAREEFSRGEVTVNRGAHDAILRRSRRGAHLGDQIRLAGIAGRGYRSVKS